MARHRLFEGNGPMLACVTVAGVSRSEFCSVASRTVLAAAGGVFSGGPVRIVCAAGSIPHRREVALPVRGGVLPAAGCSSVRDHSGNR